MRLQTVENARKVLKNGEVDFGQAAESINNGKGAKALLTGNNQLKTLQADVLNMSTFLGGAKSTTAGPSMNKLETGLNALQEGVGLTEEQFSKLKNV